MRSYLSTKEKKGPQNLHILFASPSELKNVCNLGWFGQLTAEFSRQESQFVESNMMNHFVNVMDSIQPANEVHNK